MVNIFDDIISSIEIKPNPNIFDDITPPIQPQPLEPIPKTPPQPLAEMMPAPEAMGMGGEPATQEDIFNAEQNQRNIKDFGTAYPTREQISEKVKTGVMEIGAIPFRPFEAQYQKLYQGMEKGFITPSAKEESKVLEAQAMFPEIFGKDMLVPDVQTKILDKMGLDGADRIMARIGLFLSEAVLTPGGASLGGVGLREAKILTAGEKIEQLVNKFGLSAGEAANWLRTGQTPFKVITRFAAKEPSTGAIILNALKETMAKVAQPMVEPGTSLQAGMARIPRKPVVPEGKIPPVAELPPKPLTTAPGQLPPAGLPPEGLKPVLQGETAPLIGKEIPIQTELVQGGGKLPPKPAPSPEFPEPPPIPKPIIGKEQKAAVMKADIRGQKIPKEQPGLVKTIELESGISKMIYPESPSFEPVTLGQAGVRLRVALRAEEKAGTTGYKMGSKETKEILTANFKEQQAKLQGLKQRLVGIIKKEIPAENQGLLLSSLAQVKSERKAWRVLFRAREYASVIKEKRLVSNINTIVNKAERSMSPKYQEIFLEAQKPIDLAKDTSDTVRRLEGIQKALERNPDLRLFHPELVSEIKRLGRKPISQMTFDEKQLFYDKLQDIRKIGILHKKLLANQRRAFIAKEATDFVGGINPPKYAGRISPTSWNYRVKRWVNNNISWARVINDTTKTGSYMDTPMKHVKNMASAETTAFHNNINRTGQFLDELRGYKNSITDKEITDATYWLYKEQPRVDRELLDVYRTEYKMAVEPPRDKRLIDIMRKEATRKYDDVREMVAITEGRLLPKAENYFPIKYEGEITLGLDPIDIMHPTQAGSSFGSIEKGFTKGTVVVKKKLLRSDSLNTLLEHIDDEEFYLTMQPVVTDVRAVIEHSTTRAALGEENLRIWRDGIRTVAGRGYNHGYQTNGTLRGLRGNITQGLLAFKASSAALQPLAIADAMAFSTAKWGIRASADILAEFTKAWIRPDLAREYIKSSPELMRRWGGGAAGETAVEDLLARGTKGVISKTKRKLTEYGMLPLRTGDIVTASGVQSGIEKVLTRYGIKNPKQEAEFLMNLVSGSGNTVFKPLSLGKSEYNRAFFTLQNFMLNRASLIWSDLIKQGLIRGDVRAKIYALVSLGILGAAEIVEQNSRDAINSVITGKKHKDKSLTRTIVDAGGGLVQIIPWFGNIAASSLALSDYPVETDVPIQKFIEETGKGTKQIFTGKKKGSTAKGLVRMTSNLGVLSGIPGAYEGGRFIMGRMKSKPGINWSLPEEKTPDKEPNIFDDIIPDEKQ